MSNEELVLRIQNGDRSLMETLWEQNKALVYTTVKKYTNLAELDDLMQEGYLGLYKAVETYNPAAGASFSTYAVNGIRRSILNYLRTDRSVKVAAGQQEQVYKWQQFKKLFLARYNREPVDWEICSLMDISYKQLCDIKKAAAAGTVKSLDAPVAGEDEITLSELIASPDNGFENLIQRIDHQRMKQDLWEAVDGLEQMQAEAIHLKFQENLTLKQIGERLGVTESNVRTLENKGIRKLRHSSVIKRLEPYYEEYVAAAYRRTSFTSFQNTFTSSEEWHILQRERQGRL